MIVLGSFEPPRDVPRSIGRENLSVTSLLDVHDGRGDAIVITVPRASVMVALDVAANRVGTMSIYYEYDPSDGETEKREVLARTFGSRSIPEGAWLIGHFWFASQLIAVYARTVGS